MSLSLPSPLGKNELRENQIWELGALFEEEVKRLRVWVEERAEENLGAPNSTIESAGEAGDAIQSEVLSTYGRRTESERINRLRDAEAGKIENDAPPRGFIVLFTVLKFMAMISEVSIFVYMFVMNLATPVAIFVGMLLALAGALTGYGLGRLLISGWQGSMGWISLLSGGAMITVLSIVRSAGQGNAFASVAITVTLALLIAIFQALEMVYKNKYNEARVEMYKCQRVVATREHVRLCTEGFWVKIYGAEVRRLALTRDEIAVKMRATFDKRSDSAARTDK